MQKDSVKIAITHGDPNGIGYEVIIKTLIENKITELCTPIIFGNKTSLDFWIEQLPSISNFKVNVIPSADKAVKGKINFVNVGQNYTPQPGVSDTVAGSMAIAALVAAVREAKSGNVDAIVTCPIDKNNTKGANFDFVGHTEYLASEFGSESILGKPLMFMVSDILKVGLVTMHIPLGEVSQKVTSQTILDTIKMVKSSMESDFMITQPKIGVLGLNPHAGDSGVIGAEDMQVIVPAIKTAQDDKVFAFGPFAADGYFGSGQFAKFDATVAMYHDQGLVPFKAIAFDEGVNFTAGLSVVRTSPAHGVGYDIAGQNKANPASFRAAIYTAIDVFRNREIDDKIRANPLKITSKQHGYNAIE